MTEHTDLANSGSGMDALPRISTEIRLRDSERTALDALPFDLILTFALTVCATAAILSEGPPAIRVPLGVLLILGLPGFAIMSLLFPSTDGPDGIARMALSVALSLATIPILALTIERSPWRIDRITMTLGLAGITTFALIAGVALRARLPIDERFAVSIRKPTAPSPREWTREQIVLVAAFSLAASLFVYGGLDAALTRIGGEPTTEFALYNGQGQAQFYPRDITIGQAAVVLVSIANHEGTRVRYKVVVSGAGRAMDDLADLAVEDGDIQQIPVRFTVTKVGEELPVRFELYRVDGQPDSKPYRLLELLVDGQEPARSQ